MGKLTPLDKIKEALRQIPHYPRTLRLIWEAAHGLTIAWAFLLLIQGLLPVATVYLTKVLINGLVSLPRTGFSWQAIGPVLLPAALMGSVLLLGEITQSILDWVRSAQAEFIDDYVTNLIHEKSAAVDLAFYESPEYYDHLHRARSEASSRSLALLESSGSLVQNTITLISMAAVIIPYGVWLPAILFLGTFPALLVVVRYNSKYHRWWERTTTDRRWAQYYDHLLTNSAVASEIRLFDLGNYFQSFYQSIRRRLRSERLQLIREQSLSRLLAGGIALIATGVALFWIAERFFQGLFTLGDLALFYQAYNLGQNLMRSLLGNVSQIYTNSLFLSNLYEFLGLESQIPAPNHPAPAPSVLKNEIAFRNVKFSYPGSETRVLDNFNISFPAGRITAIVGQNGAGKSTLVKLLCRFYDPEEGIINLDGIDIRDLTIEALRQMITVMFQLPVPYYATAAQNISMGDLSIGTNQTAIETAAIDAGADEIIKRLPKGYATLLGKLFIGGSELSVGEWQRIALARAFIRKAPIMILDEPTSSMDPWAETDWMSRFRTLTRGCTTILITHRFTTARYADIIYVMKEGNVIESGSHEELIRSGGLYAHSWEAQVRGNHRTSEEILRESTEPVR